MKKTTIKISLLAVVASSLSIANAAPEGFYLGADVGYSKTKSVKGNKAPFFYDTVEDFVEYQIYDKIKFKTDSVAYAIKMGYKFNPYFAVEGSLNRFGNVNQKVLDIATRERGTLFNNKLKAYGGTIAVKGLMPIDDVLDVYGKVGVAIVQNKYNEYVNGEKTTYDYIDYSKFKDRRTSANLLLGFGVEYAITPKLSLIGEYQYIRHTKLKDAQALYANGVGVRAKPSYHTISLGLNYYFGIKPKPEVETLSTVTLSNDVLFDFNKYNLKQAAEIQLKDLANKVNEVSADQRSVSVAGYADRIGSQAYNLKLSEKRANSVASYLDKQGISNITASGYGQSNPVTANQCDDVKERKKLIQCLAPDRRVEVNVQGIKK